MLFDFAALPPNDRYKLMTATIVPRPIAWVVSQDAAGRVNAAPFSFFNAFASDPPVICLGINGTGHEPGSVKDSAANIRATRQFVVCLVPYDLVDPMHVTALEFPPQVDELAEAGLRAIDSSRVAPPRIEGSPVAFECELNTTVELGSDAGTLRGILIGRIVAMHVRDDAVLDAARCHIDTGKLDLVGRLGANGYVRASGPGLFTRARLKLSDWVRRT